MRTRSWSCCVAVLMLATAAAVAQTPTWNDAVSRYDRDIESEDEKVRTAAILGLAGPADPAIFAFLEKPVRDGARFLDQYEKKRQALAAALENLQRDLESDDAERKRKAERARLDLLEQQTKNEAQIQRLRSELDASVEALARVGTTLTRNTGADYLKRVQKHAFDHDEWYVRVAYVDVLSRIRKPGVLDLLLECIQQSTAETAKLEKLRKKKDRAFTKALDRFARQSTRTAYEKMRTAQAEVAGVAEQEHGERKILDLAYRGLARQARGADGSVQAAELDKVLRAFRSAANPEQRAGYLLALGRIGGPEVKDAVRTFAFRPATGPADRIAAVQALGVLQDTGAVPMLLDLLDNPLWAVRSAVVDALRQIRDRRAVEPLIARLETEDGRMVDDVQSALEDLTGQRFGANTTLWKQWFARNGSSFQVPTRPDPKAAAVATADRTKGEEGGTSFYGIFTRSQNIVYVLDVSGSMSEEAAGDTTKLATAKQELLKAVSALKPGAQFNVVFYATGVQRWQKKMVKAGPATTRKLKKALDGLSASGATNAHGALMDALALAGVGGYDKRYRSCVDTLYFLSDGMPTVGAVLNPERILEEVRSLNQLRRIVIHAVGVGKDHNVDFMRRLAEENRGTYAAR